MSESTNLIGGKFGRWKILQLVGTNKRGKRLCVCRCDCGNTKTLVLSNVRNGHTKSCGCFRNETTSKRSFKDLTRQRFGKLTVQRLSGKKRRGNYLWVCLCDCGREAIVSSSNLLTGETKSCGCLHKEVVHDRCFKDLTGQRFGRLAVQRYAGKNKHKQSLWLCICDCGIETTVASNLLTGHRTQSCGCLRREKLILARTTHNRSGTSEYETWGGMIKRCTNPKTKGFNNYGGRGIKVCDRWLHSFEDFFADMGEKPQPKHLYSLDRYPDVNGDYKPSNCRWATRREQMANTRPYIALRENTLLRKRIAELTGSGIEPKISMMGNSAESSRSGRDNSALEKFIGGNKSQMPSIEECFERAPKLAQQIVNYWASNKLRDNPPTFTDQFEALVTKAGDYQREKARAGKYRKSKLWNEREDATEETTTRQAFAEAYKIFVEKHPEAEAWFPGR